MLLRLGLRNGRMCVLRGHGVGTGTSSRAAFSDVSNCTRAFHGRFSLDQAVCHLCALQLFALFAGPSGESFRSRLPSFLGLLPLDDAREVVCDTEVERRGLELNFTAHDLCPLVPRGVYPSHEIEVVHPFQSAEIRTLHGCNDVSDVFRERRQQ